MTLAEIKINVQTIFPIKFTESLIYSEDATYIDKTIDIAIKRVYSKFEKIEGREITGSQLFDRAASILKCVPSAIERKTAIVSVWDTMSIPGDYVGNVKHYFGPDKYLRLWPADATVWIEYVVSPDKLVVEDLSIMYVNWVIEYANALLKIKEGYLGTSAILTALPFEFNYKELLSDGTNEKKELEEKLDTDLFTGVLGIRVN